MRPLLLTNGRVIDPAAAVDGRYDVLVREGEVEAVEPAGALTADDAQTIDCEGWWVVPGLIDPHVHLRDPGFPHKETILSGLTAAARGGFTAVAAMANTLPVNDTPAVTRYMVERAGAAHAARLIPVAAVTVGLAGQALTDFAAMVDAGARLFSDDGVPLDDQVILGEAFAAATRVGFAISLHEEDRGLTGCGACNAGAVAQRLGVAGIPIAAETQRVRRDLAMAIGAGAPVHIAHVATAEALELIRLARARGANVTCEATPHHFTLDEEAFLRWGPNAKMAPPLRRPDDVAALQAGLADGTIDMIATDHAPHDRGAKQLDRLGGRFGSARGRLLTPAEVAILADAANGIVGLETALGLALALVHRGVISASRMVELMSLNPARLLRLATHGTLACGATADLTIIDPNREWRVDPAEFASLSRNTPFTGMKLQGQCVMTIVNGTVVYAEKRAEDSRTGR